MAKIVKKLRFTKVCAKCKKERKAGALMYWERIIEDGCIKHVHTCVECPQNQNTKPKDFVFPPLGGHCY